MNMFRDKFKGNLLPLSILFLLVFTHFFCLNRYGINIPFSDDYNEILKNMNLILDSGSFSESVQQILYGNGFSKPIMLRLISLLHISTIHEINFRYLVFTGNVFLVFTSLVFAVSVSNINKYLIVAVGCFVFQPQYWEAIYQSTLSNSVFTCLFFSLTSILCLFQKKTGFYVTSLFFVVLAQLSFGNGFLVYPILFMISAVYKNWKLCAVVLTQAIVTTWLYMFGATVSYTAGEQIGLITKLKMYSTWLPEFIGSSVGYVFGSGYERTMVGKTVSITVGIVILSIYLFIIWKKYYQKNLLIFSFMTFFILTALLATKLRFNAEVPGASRYQIQSALCILTALVIIVDMYAAKMNKFIVIILVIIFPMFFMLASYKTNLQTVSWHKGRLAVGLWSWLDRGQGLTIWSGEEAAGRVLMRSSNLNIYKIPSKQTLIVEAWKH